jgi:serine/threonine-protein kinase
VSVSVGELIQSKYRIVRLIGQGGMGAVYEGLNEGIARRVAIKVLHGELASQHGIVERFEREAKAAGKIGNDHILEVLDLGALDDGDRFMVMEYLDGETLEQRLNHRGPLLPQEVCPLMRQLLVGLSAAHDAGIIHRDLKPDNIFVLREKAGQPDFVKIIDFGISKFTALSSDMRMTATGAVMGTPYFMAPEQAKGSRDADIRSDLYAVGVILYRAVTGTVPFDAGSFNELLFKIVLADTPRASSVVPNLDPAFDDLIFRAMARDPADRFQSAMHLVRALDEWCAGEPSGRASTGSERTRRSHGAPPRADSANWAGGVLATQFADSRASASGASVDTGMQTEWGQALPVVPANSRGRTWMLVLGSIGLVVLLALGIGALRDAPDSSSGITAVSAAPVAHAAASVAASTLPVAAPVVAAPPVAVSPATAALESDRPSTVASPTQVDGNAQVEATRPKSGSVSIGAGKKRIERPVAAGAAQVAAVPPPEVAAPPPPQGAPKNPPRKAWDYDY